MIIAIVGGIGSGKSLTAVKNIVCKNQFVFTNFELFKGIDYHRIKISDIIKQTDEKGTISPADMINWDFWNEQMTKHKNFSIYLNEIHISALGARRFASKTNQAMVNWISQIRKITNDSEFNHLFLISQQFRKIDIDARELAQIIIECNCVEPEPGNPIIINKYFNGDVNYDLRISHAKTWFWGKEYFEYYKTLELIRFGAKNDFL